MGSASRFAAGRLQAAGLPVAELLGAAQIGARLVEGLGSSWVRALLDDEQFDAYCWRVRWEIDTQRFDRAPRHRLFGAPDVIQNPMELECQLASNGVYVGTLEGYATARTKQLAHGASEWYLLAQIDSDEDLGLMWEDGGRIYWWLRHQDASAGRVDRCWGILQTT